MQQAKRESRGLLHSGHTPLAVDEHVFWLQVPVHNVVGMKVVQGEHNGRNVEARQVLGHALHKDVNT